MKKFFFILSILTFTFILSGCSNDYVKKLYSNESKIVSSANSFNLSIDSQKLSDNNFTGSFTLDGMDTLWSYDAPEDLSINLTTTLLLHNGASKLVLIDGNKKVQTLIEKKGENKKEVSEIIRLDLKKGENRIKILAKDNAKIDLTISCPIGTFKELGFQ